jgi:beta propeller repeat protein
MRSKIILAILFLICLIGSVSVAAAGKETQLTQYQRLTQSTSIHGNFVSWYETATNTVHVYDLTAGKELRILEETNCNPNIYGKKIVWSDIGANAILYDISTDKKTVIASSVYSPEIYGNYVVYNSENKIFLYNVKAHKKTQITPKASKFTYGFPIIYGNKIVWTQSNNERNTSIYVYDIPTGRKSKIVTVDSLDSLDIYENRVMWSVANNGKSNVYIRNISTHKTTQFTINGSGPEIYGNRVVYTKSYNNGGSDIYMYTISTSKVSRITDSRSAFSPSIYKDKIVYADSRDDPQNGEITDIYLYQL